SSAANRSARSHHDAPEGEVETGTSSLHAPWNRMLPVMLQFAAHQQQGSMPERNGDPPRRLVDIPEDEVALLTKVRRCDDRIHAKFLFVVSVPGEVVGAVAVPVQHDTVEFDAGKVLDLPLRVQESFIPGIRDGGDAGVGVDPAAVPIP